MYDVSVQNTCVSTYFPQHFQILEAKLYVTKHIILPSEQLKQLKDCERTPTRYPMREVQMKSFTLPVGTLSHNNQSLITSLLPDMLFIILVDSRNLEHMDLTRIYLKTLALPILLLLVTLTDKVFRTVPAALFRRRRSSPNQKHFSFLTCGM